MPLTVAKEQVMEDALRFLTVAKELKTNLILWKRSYHIWPRQRENTSKSGGQTSIT